MLPAIIPLLKVHKELRECWYKRRFHGFNTSTILLSSWRTHSRTHTGRETVSRDPRVNVDTYAGHGRFKRVTKSQSPCRITKGCHDHISFNSEGTGGSNHSNTCVSWKSEDAEDVALNPRKKFQNPGVLV